MKLEKKIYVVGNYTLISALIVIIIIYMFNPGSLVKTKQEVKSEILTIDLEESPGNISEAQQINEHQLVKTNQFKDQNQNSSKSLNIATQTLSNKLTTYQTKSTIVTTQEDNFIFPMSDLEELVSETPDLNVEIHLESVYDEIQSGSNGYFELNFEIIESQTSSQNVFLLVQMPEDTLFDQELEELEIAHVTPEYDEKKHQLTYFFEQLDSGISYKKLIKIQTKNGMIADGTKLKVSTECYTAPFSDPAYTEATTEVTSSFNFFASEKHLNDSDEPEIEPQDSIGDLKILQITFSIPKEELGQLFINEDTKIIIQDQLSENVIYISDTMNGEYDPLSHSVTWNFETPTLEEQIQVDDELFFREFIISTQLLEVGSDQSFSGQFYINITDIAGNVHEKQVIL